MLESLLDMVSRVGSSGEVLEFEASVRRAVSEMESRLDFLGGTSLHIVWRIMVS
jgi:hypothetical protein